MSQSTMAADITGRADWAVEVENLQSLIDGHDRELHRLAVILNGMLQSDTSPTTPVDRHSPWDVLYTPRTRSDTARRPHADLVEEPHPHPNGLVPAFAPVAVAPPPPVAIARRPRRRRDTVYNTTRRKLNRKAFYRHIDSRKVLKRDLKDGPVECGVCSVSLVSGDTCHRPGCKHSFCKTCLYKWLTQYCDDATCPLCRFEVCKHAVVKKTRKRKKKPTITVAI